MLEPTRSPGAPSRIRNLPLDRELHQFSACADWRLDDKNTLRATYTFERTERTHREVATTKDNPTKLNWHSRTLAWLTFRATYTWLKRPGRERSEEHTSGLQSLMRISYAVFCLNNKS